MIKKTNILIVILLTIFLYSCQGAKEAFQSKKRSDQSDEFLVKKKNPLAMPPDYEKLPIPGNQAVSEENPKDSLEVKKLLIGNSDNKSKKIDEDDECNPKIEICKNLSIEESILKKIQ